MAHLSRETSLTLDKDDMAQILTKEICSYNCFGNLRVTGVFQNNGGDFELTLEPVPTDAEG